MPTIWNTSRSPSVGHARQAPNRAVAVIERELHETTKEDMMARWWKFFLALTRLSSEAVCEMSAGRGLNNDFHNYRDSVVGQPGNGYTHTCERCGKPFVL
jgi:hypothetical protein